MRWLGSCAPWVWRGLRSPRRSTNAPPPTAACWTGGGSWWCWTTLTLATQIGNRYEQASAHNGLAHTHYAAGEQDQARHHWHDALALYTDLGVPEADDVHAHLTALDQPTGDDNGD